MDNDIYTLGTYPQGTNGKAEPIHWIILDRQDDRMLLLSDKVLDTRVYHHEYANKDGAIQHTTWKDCDIRRWLNTDFVEQAFTERDREALIRTTLDNPDNPVLGTRGGESTIDQVFLLSMADVLKYFDSTGRKWGPDDYDEFSLLICKLDDHRATGYLTDYVREQPGRYTFAGFPWWLRTPGLNGNAVCVGEDGIDVHGGNVDNNRIGVRPALWIRIWE